jgi:hypothetical protein
MAPCPTGTAFCMASPRVRSRRAASVMLKAAGRCQRRIFAERMAGDEGGVALQIEPGLGLQHAHHGEADTAISAGWALAVRVQRLGRPIPHHSVESFWESAASTSSNTAFGGKGLGEALPMPTIWEPWPGKMNAVVIGALDGDVIVIKTAPVTLLASLRQAFQCTIFLQTTAPLHRFRLHERP